MAGFTGLSLTQGASARSVAERKVIVAISAVVLGGGIWSMHFVAMLGLQLPVPYFYDALTTLISVLIAVLVVGFGLLLLHFRERNRTTITAAGLIFGLGILAMHYVGMAGIEACRAEYTGLGLAASVTVSLGLSTVAIWVAYGERTHRNIILGTVCFAIAVGSLHFLAIWGTRFFEDASVAVGRAIISNELLAFLVTLSTFVICGGFLLSGVTFLPGAPAPAGEAREALREAVAAPVEPVGEKPACNVPYEKNGRTYFADCGAIAAFRAEGHYTIIYHGAEKNFCPWSISDAVSRLEGSEFIRAHRSYLVNPAHVTGFERKKDSGVIYFDRDDSLQKVPVSRTRLGEVREILGL
ncbi:MAG: LytTR family transcriptional regulator DNA-binding domain-containing protein [Rhodobacteraceae bacterium]|nr:LytTR family transcriptional regulator DNA-binding domain-containing protein [Paracoccaceae bacterium]